MDPAIPTLRSSRPRPASLPVLSQQVASPALPGASVQLGHLASSRMSFCDARGTRAPDPWLHPDNAGMFSTLFPPLAFSAPLSAPMQAGLVDFFP